MSILDDLHGIRERALAAISSATDLRALDEVRVAVSGKKGELTAVLRGMGQLAADVRPQVGKLANEVRTQVVFGLVAAAYGLYAITNHVGNYGIYFALFGFAAIFLFSSYNMLPTARNNHSAIMKRADRAEQAAADYVKRYPNGAFPVPSYYAHPTVLKQMMDAIEEGRAVTVPEALEAVKARLKALNADVQVEQEEYDEVVLIKAMFLNHQYA